MSAWIKMRSFGILYATLCVSACATLGQGPAGLHDAQLERLYFGRNIGDTATVSDSAWAVFKREVVVPGMPEGSTTFLAEGTWRAPDGSVAVERSIVVEFLHPVAQSVEAPVRRIIDEYKRRFAQQAVLRVTTRVRAGY